MASMTFGVSMLPFREAHSRSKAALCARSPSAAVEGARWHWRRSRPCRPLLHVCDWPLWCLLAPWLLAFDYYTHEACCRGATMLRAAFNLGWGVYQQQAMAGRFVARYIARQRCGALQRQQRGDPRPVPTRPSGTTINDFDGMLLVRHAWFVQRLSGVSRATAALVQIAELGETNGTQTRLYGARRRPQFRHLLVHSRAPDLRRSSRPLDSILAVADRHARLTRDVVRGRHAARGRISLTQLGD